MATTDAKAAIGRTKEKNRLYALFTQVAAAMANPHRLELLDLLAQAPRTVEELATEAHMTMANTSQHLQRLKRARLVLDEREGVHIRYRLAGPAVGRLWLEMRAVGERQLAEVERALDSYRDRRHEFETITPEQLMRRLEKGDVTLLDVRPRAEYEAGHIPGALSAPIDDLPDRLDDFPRDRSIVAYCRGPYCVYADQALEQLARRGRQVARLEEGVAEWQAAGHPLAV